MNDIDSVADCGRVCIELVEAENDLALREDLDTGRRPGSVRVLIGRNDVWHTTNHIPRSDAQDVVTNHSNAAHW